MNLPKTNAEMRQMSTDSLLALRATCSAAADALLAQMGRLLHGGRGQNRPQTALNAAQGRVQRVDAELARRGVDFAVETAHAEAVLKNADRDADRAEMERQQAASERNCPEM